MQANENSLVLFPVPLTQLSELINAAVESAIKAISLSPLQPPKKEEYLTRQQAASKLSINKDTLSRLTKAGKIKSHNLGRRVFYKPADIDGALKVNIYK